MLTIAGGIILAIVILALICGMFSGFEYGAMSGVGTVILFGTLLLILVSCMA